MRSTGNSYYTSTTTSALLSEVLGDGAFNSYFSAHKTGWSYAGNGDLTDAGRLTELAGTAWAWWTDNSADGVQGNVTALAIAPNAGGSAGKVFIYNDQGSGYSPGWREVWTSASDGSGSGLDADLLDGQHGSYYYPASNPNGYTTNVGDITGVTAGNGLTGGGASGSVTISMSGSYTGNFTASGDVTAFSDERLKSNVKTIDSALEKVQNLRGVTFDKDGREGLGVIAQEVQAVIPQVVIENEEYLSVAYGNMVGLLIEAIKEQQVQIEELKAKLE